MLLLSYKAKAKSFTEGLVSFYLQVTTNAAGDGVLRELSELLQNRKEL